MAEAERALALRLPVDLVVVYEVFLRRWSSCRRLTMSGEEREVFINFLIGVLLCVAILASYVPQHVECMHWRSTQGLSLWTVLISSVSCAAATLSSLLGDWRSIKAATLPQDDTSFLLRLLQISNASMPTFQNLITVVAGTPTYILYYFCFARREMVTRASSSRIPLYFDSSMHRLEVTVAASTWVSVAVAVAGSVWVLVIFGSGSSFPAGLSKFWGIVAAVSNTIQWIPQVDATWSAQHEGVLSATSLIISVLVDILVAAFWIIGPRESFWIYMSLATDAFLQILLIGMIYFFRIRRRDVGCEHEANSMSDSSLSNPLLVPVNSAALCDNFHSEIIE
jgi:uncharacterized protein with PQ loop repeat